MGCAIKFGFKSYSSITLLHVCTSCLFYCCSILFISCLYTQISERVQKGLNAKDIITIMILIGDVRYVIQTVYHYAQTIYYIASHRESFNETLDIDFNNYGQLIDPAIEKDLQAT